MIKFANTHVTGMDTAIRSMRMPLQSFNKSDSYWDGSFSDYVDEYPFVIGPNDLDLARRLVGANNEAHKKFLRSIQVYTEITAPALFFAEWNTYKVSTVLNSSSLQHTGSRRDYTPEDFSIDVSRPYAGFGLSESETDLRTIIEIINKWRQKYKDTNDYTYFRIMRELMPQGYNYTASWTGNYAVLRSMWIQRVEDKHRLLEWHDGFKQFVESLPYASDLITYQPNKKEESSNG